MAQPGKGSGRGRRAAEAPRRERRELWGTRLRLRSLYPVRLSGSRRAAHSIATSHSATPPPPSPRPAAKAKNPERLGPGRFSRPHAAPEPRGGRGVASSGPPRACAHGAAPPPPRSPAHSSPRPAAWRGGDSLCQLWGPQSSAPLASRGRRARPRAEGCGGSGDLAERKGQSRTF